MPDAFDFTGLFAIQRNYVADLSAISSVPHAQELSTKLDNLYATYQTASPASSVALDHQNKMINIISTEKTRLDQKKTGIDNAYSTQQRLVQLNESYREKNMQYINILIIVIITIVIYLALLIIEQNLSFIPSVLMDSLKTLLFMITFIIICVMIARINKRDPMDYQKLLFVAPPDMSNNITGNTITGNIIITGNTASSGCTQSACCSDETEWNNDVKLCVPKEDYTDIMNGFTLIGQVCGNNNCKKCGGDSVQYIPYTPYEFDSYVKI
jgi:hypothetical protein